MAARDLRGHLFAYRLIGLDPLKVQSLGRLSTDRHSALHFRPPRSQEPTIHLAAGREDAASNPVANIVDSTTTFISFESLSADTYTLTITDSLGCSSTGLVTLGEPDSLAGFSLRAVQIRERQRRMLMETFQDQNTNDAQVNAVLTGLDSLGGDFVRLHYPLDGPFFDQNPTPPRVRRLYYGISLTDQGVMDGNQYNGPLEGLALNDLNLRSLQAPGVNVLDLQGDRLQLSGVTRSDLVAMRLALVQDVADQPALVRAILPDGAGVLLDLAVGIDQEISLTDAFSSDLPLTVQVDSSEVYAVLWLQDLQSKEVWQAARFDSVDWESLLSNLSLERRRRPRAEPAPVSLRVYPNPARDHLSIAWPQPLVVAQPWWLFDAQGRQVLAGQAKAGLQQIKLDLGALSEGLYHLRVPDPQTGRMSHGKVSVLR
jgi:hypothetical protein